VLGRPSIASISRRLGPIELAPSTIPSYAVYRHTSIKRAGHSSQAPLFCLYYLSGIFLLFNRNLLIVLTISLLLASACTTKSSDLRSLVKASPVATAAPLMDESTSQTLSALDINALSIEQAQMAFADAGFVNFGPDTQDDGTPIVVGYHNLNDVAVGIIGEPIERVRIIDFSGGQNGLEELTLISSLFVPDAHDWLRAAIEEAQADQGVAYAADRTFGASHVFIESYTTDAGRELSVYVESAP